MTEPEEPLLRIEWRRGRSIRPIELGEEALVLPGFPLGRGVIRMPYRDVLDARLLDRGRRLVIGSRRRLPLQYRVAALREPGDAQRLLDEIRRRLGREEGGEDLVRAFDRRGALAAGVSAAAWTSRAAASLLLVAFVFQGLTRAATWAPGPLIALGANAPLLVARGELDRLVTGNLLHGGLLHFLANTLILLTVGAQVEHVLGWLRTALILIASCIAGSLASSLVAQAPLSIGASTAVLGALGALAQLNLSRREELHAGLRVPAGVAAVAVTVQILAELLLPGIDHAAHLGGFLAGFGAAALVSGRTPLAELRGDRRCLPRWAATVSILVFALGLGRGVYRMVEPDPQSLLVVAEQLLREPGTPGLAINNMAMRVAASPAAGPELLELATEAVAAWLVSAPEADFAWDTLAALQARRGDLPGAIESQRRAFALRPVALYLANLLRFQDAHLRERGVLRIGEGSEIGVELIWSQPDSGREDPGALVLRLDPVTRVGLVVHGLAYADGRPAVHIEFAIGAGAGPEIRFSDPRYGTPEVRALELRLALVDARASDLPDGTAAAVWLPVGRAAGGGPEGDRPD